MNSVLPQYFVGVDGGGTSCRVAVSDASGSVLGRGTAGSSNITSDIDGALKNINLAIERAFDEAGIEDWTPQQINVVMGLAGANVDDAGLRLTNLTTFANCKVVTDPLIAHRGAFGPADGLLAIVGTGSAFLKIVGDAQRSYGGWGSRVGDLSSGAWIGRAAIENALLAYDAIRPMTDLSQQILSRSNGRGEDIAVHFAHAEPGGFAEFAPLVVEAAAKKDTAAVKIMLHAASDLNEALTAFNREHPVSICLWGGLAEVYAPLLSKDNAARLQRPQSTALDGALSLAIECFLHPHQR